jgi:hypothetical protein
MAFQKKTPPIKIRLNINDFNKLVEVISIQSENENEDIKNNSVRLKEKLLRYSIPFTNDDSVIIEIRFYPREIAEMFYVLFNGIEDVEVKTNYYDVLVKVRENIKNKKQDKE